MFTDKSFQKLSVQISAIRGQFFSYVSFPVVARREYHFPESLI